MKKYLLVLSTIFTSLLIYSCEESPEMNHSNFTVNINGKDYIYTTKTSHHYADREIGFGDMQIMGENAEYGELSHCVINIEYKMQGDGEYTITNLATLNSEVEARTNNKYVHVHVNLGKDFKENIAKYRFPDREGSTIAVNEEGGYYDFTFFEPVSLNKTNYLGNPPSNAPFNIKLKVSKVYL